MKAQWTRFPENWKGVDPCGNNWVGISCYNNKGISVWKKSLESQFQPYRNFISYSAALQAMKAQWTRFPENWKGVDPCGSNWVGISCYNNKVVSISLGNLNV
ncbi:hypothetical protein Bca4012_000442 [Brassica carinata]